MCRAILAAVLVLAAFASAQEQRCVPGQTPAVSNHNVRLDRTAAQTLQAPSPVGPVWTKLARMAPAERANARINIELAANATSEAQAFARTIEANWNDGRYDDALAGFESLARLTDPAEMAIGCSWRKPVPTLETGLWGSDVRIGNRDSIRLVSLDVDRASGHLFAVMMLDGDSYASSWTMNFSNDGGQTWSETFQWWASYNLNSMSASVLATHSYIAFGRGPGQDQAFLYRCKTSDGTQENFNNGSAYITVFTLTSDSIKEVALTGNQDFYNNRLYYMGITTAGNLKFFWSDTGAITWTEIATSVSNADRGLSDCTNEGYDSLFVWASYFDKSNNLRIDADKPGDAWGNVYSASAESSMALTSIGAYHDTVLCAFDHRGTTNYWCKYFTSAYLR